MSAPLAHIPGLIRPRVATPRLGLATKGKPAKNPFGANKMTVKMGSLAGKALELQKVAEVEKEAILAEGLGMVARGAARVAERGPQMLGNFARRVSQSAAGAAETQFTRRIAQNTGDLKNLRNLRAPDTYTGPQISEARAARSKLFAGRREVRALRGTPPAASGAAPAAPAQAAPVPTPTRAAPAQATPATPAQAAPAAAPAQPAASQAAPTQGAPPPSPMKSFADKMKNPSAKVTPAAPGEASKALDGVVRMLPLGVAGGLTGYGALRGWGEGQAEVARSQANGFNPQSRF